MANQIFKGTRTGDMAFLNTNDSPMETAALVVFGCRSIAYLDARASYFAAPRSKDRLNVAQRRGEDCPTSGKLIRYFEGRNRKHASHIPSKILKPVNSCTVLWFEYVLR